jgi:fumarate reductase (CoM/CoB) subunit A
MEFIQFYPWRLIEPFRSTRMPIQPSTFALGAKLFNSRGERFMVDYDPLRKESTTRDLSARGIGDQIRKGLAVDGGVILDVADVPDDQFRFENPRVVELLDKKKLDYRKIKLIVAPEAHYFMGGVDIDEQGSSSITGLYAAGENAGGVHGGNRLNSNAIPDTLVFGHRAGIAAAIHAQSVQQRASISLEKSVLPPFENVSAGIASSALLEATDALRDLLGANLALVRDETGLNRVIEEATKIEQMLQSMECSTIGDVVAQSELRDLSTTAILSAKSALCRKESRAAHFRSDFPASDATWLRTVLVQSDLVETRAILIGSDEQELEAYRNAHMKKSEPAGREHVE